MSSPRVPPFSNPVGAACYAAASVTRYTALTVGNGDGTAKNRLGLTSGVLVGVAVGVSVGVDVGSMVGVAAAGGSLESITTLSKLVFQPLLLPNVTVEQAPIQLIGTPGPVCKWTCPEG